jgi:hypothetical protein
MKKTRRNKLTGVERDAELRGQIRPAISELQGRMNEARRRLEALELRADLDRLAAQVGVELPKSPKRS